MTEAAYAFIANCVADQWTLKENRRAFNDFPMLTHRLAGIAARERVATPLPAAGNHPARRGLPGPASNRTSVAPPDCDHRGSEHDAALIFKEARPDDNIGNACFILDGHEHDTLGASRLLADGNKTRGNQPATVAQEADRMGSQSHARMSVILDDIGALRHLPKRRIRLLLCGDYRPLAIGGRRE